MPQRARLAVLFVVIAFNVLGLGLMLPVVPILVRELTGGEVGTASAIYGWLIALYSLMQFTLGPAMGALSDRFGRRPIILISLVGLSLDYLLLALAPTIGWVVVARIVGGAMGASIATATAYIADITPPERRAQNFGLIGAAFGVGYVAGPLIGGLLGAYGSRVPFFAASAMGVVALVFAWFKLGESLAPEHRRAFSLTGGQSARRPSQGRPLPERGRADLGAGARPSSASACWRRTGCSTPPTGSTGARPRSALRSPSSASWRRSPRAGWCAWWCRRSASG